MQEKILREITKKLERNTVKPVRKIERRH